jgi:hypothetical protein
MKTTSEWRSTGSGPDAFVAPAHRTPDREQITRLAQRADTIADFVLVSFTQYIKLLSDI